MGGERGPAEVIRQAHHTDTPILRAPSKNVVQKALSPDDARCCSLRSRSTFPNPSAADARMRRFISAASVGYLPGLFVERLASPVACNFEVLIRL